MRVGSPLVSPRTPRDRASRRLVIRIAMISDHETYGGAAIAATRLAEGLRRIGVEVHRVVASTDPTRGHDEPPVPERVGVRRRYQLAAGVLPPGRRDELWRPWTARRLDRALTRLRPDVVNLHNLHGAFGAGWSVDMARVAARHAPVVWTLHDMWSFTGRCPFNEGCRRFEQQCTLACPTADQYPALPPFRVPEEFDLRRTVFREVGERLTAVAPSRWLADEARIGLWRDHRVDVIPYGIDHDLFRPEDTAESRRALGIPADQPTLLTAAQYLSDRRKGVDLLFDALHHLPTRPLTVAMLGADAGVVPSVPSGVMVRPLGQLSDPVQLRRAYSAADVLVHPARQDNAPLVVQEAIACGTPAVAFPVTGTPELIDARSGRVARDMTASGLAEAIGAALDADELDARAASLERARSLESQAARYRELFVELTGSFTR